jgi:hypothetical protein
VHFHRSEHVKLHSDSSTLSLVSEFH